MRGARPCGPALGKKRRGDGGIVPGGGHYSGLFHARASVTGSAQPTSALEHVSGFSKLLIRVVYLQSAIWRDFFLARGMVLTWTWLNVTMAFWQTAAPDCLQSFRVYHPTTPYS